jgi:hypothetical protein
MSQDDVHPSSDKPKKKKMVVVAPCERRSAEPARDLAEQRIDEFRAAALSRNDPLAACVGAQIADLLQFSHDLGPLLASAIGDVSSVAELQDLGAPIARATALARQIERYARLDREVTNAPVEKKSAAGNPLFPLGY